MARLEVGGKKKLDKFWGISVVSGLGLALIPDVRSQTRIDSTDLEYKLDTSTSVLKWKKHEGD